MMGKVISAVVHNTDIMKKNDNYLLWSASTPNMPLNGRDSLDFPWASPSALVSFIEMFII
jgi:hypothetical protein